MLRHVRCSMKKTLSFKEGEDFYTTLIAERNALNAKRFTYTIEKNENSVDFTIDAKDAVAMKAATSSITKLHTIFVKMRDIQ
jgi:tRNA threonylcarbamoyladenosine modification (KEOPS) complex  Pcc1 subunit